MILSQFCLYDSNLGVLDVIGVIGIVEVIGILGVVGVPGLGGKLWKPCFRLTGVCSLFFHAQENHRKIMGKP